MKSKNRLCIKNLAGALAIPVLVAILLQGICMAKGKTMIMNMTSFDNFVVYIAIVMITTIALSINLKCVIIVSEFCIIKESNNNYQYRHNNNCCIKPVSCYVICGGLMGIVGFLNASRNTTINGGQLNFGSISIMFTAFLPMFIGSYISRFTNEKIGFLLAALCMSMLNSTFSVFSNEVNASMQAIINALLLVVFLIYLSNEHLLIRVFTGKRK